MGNEIRISQAIRTFGTGSIVDFPDLSLMMISPDEQEFSWGFDESSNGFDKNIVKDERLQNLLGVDFFVLPPSKTNKYVGLKALQFPGNCYCPDCRTIYNINHLISNYPHYYKIVIEKRSGAWFCVSCFEKNGTKYTLIPSRFIIATEYGLIDDFPYDWYCHKNEKYRPNRIEGGDGKCAISRNHSHLKLEFEGASLSDIYVKCKVCSARESLGPIFDLDNPVLMLPLNYLWNRNGMLSAPWKGINYKTHEFYKETVYAPPNLKEYLKGAIKKEEKDVMKKYFPRVLQRGAGNVFFPVNYIGFVLPKNFYTQSKEKPSGKEFNKFIDVLILINKGNIEEQPNTLLEKCKIILSLPKEIINSTCIGAGINQEDFFQYIEINSEENKSFLIEKNEKSRYDEFKCFTSKIENLTKNDWFKNEIKDVNTSNYPELNKFLNKVVLLHKLKQLNIQKGFTRVRP
ncbi:MAG: hypothetical protein KDC67_00750, partial [Ignavibacteriae bacterium]|nr:hypothetical protein [Ignavibacteriota bacterium]